MAGEQPQAEGYNWVVPSNQRTSWAMRKLVSLLLLLTESQGSGATLGSLNLLPHHRPSCCAPKRRLLRAQRGSLLARCKLFHHPNTMPQPDGWICHPKRSMLQLLDWV